MLKYSSHIYMVSVQSLVEGRVELIRRTKENAFRSDPQRKNLPAEERGRLWEELKAKIAREGFSSEHPIEVLLLRSGGKDKIWQGHHRLAIAIELGLKEVPVRYMFESEPVAATREQPTRPRTTPSPVHDRAPKTAWIYS